MLRVLRILNRFNLGGPTFNAAYLTKYMGSDFETLLVGGANDSSEKNSEYIANQLGLNPQTISCMRREISPYNDFRALQQLKNIIRNFRPHIVHTHASNAGALGRQAAISLNAPVIVHTFHGHVFDSYFNNMKAGLYKTIERHLAKKSSGIIAISENQKDDLANKYKICESEKIKVIPLGFDLNRFKENMDYKRFEFRSKYQIKDDEIAIGIIGRLVPVKNHEMFLVSLKQLLGKTSKKVKAFIIGDGEMRKHLERKTSQLGLNQLSVNGNTPVNNANITFTSWITEMDEVNAGMDIIALTSLNEGTPVSLIEAQAANKPIVTTAVGGIENVVMPNKTALISQNNPDDFSEKLLQLVENDALREGMSKAGWDHVSNRYHYKRLIKDMTNYYLELLEKSKTPHRLPVVV